MSETERSLWVSPGVRGWSSPISDGRLSSSSSVNRVISLLTLNDRSELCLELPVPKQLQWTCFSINVLFAPHNPICPAHDDKIAWCPAELLAPTIVQLQGDQEYQEPERHRVRQSRRILSAASSNRPLRPPACPPWMRRIARSHEVVRSTRPNFTLRPTEKVRHSHGTDSASAVHSHRR